MATVGDLGLVGPAEGAEQLLTREKSRALAVDQSTQTEATSSTTVELVREVPAPVEVVKEVIREVVKIKEVVKEVHIREDMDKINDTDIEVDLNGRYKIFESTSNSDDPESQDRLTFDFQQRTKVAQIQILLAEVKRSMADQDEVNIKIEYLKKLYAEQVRKLVLTQRTLKEKEIELEIRATEIQIKDELIKRQDSGNNENLTLFKEQEANQATMIAKLQHQMKELVEEHER